ncbi:DUF4363 family protein [Sediminibacillus massiliensis]|uniref:DUF4363 family protein n=1 Tax=Sediminibacillus massiliensis TaxID=1926277 RepID=UPI0015C2C8D4|nr:DUF4363 family protein [Sediminibacillus massiliensis]
MKDEVVVLKKLSLTFALHFTLACFVAIMISGSYLKEPFGQDDQLYKRMTQLETHITKQDWDRAEADLIYLEKAWDKVSKRVQFSVEKGNMAEISGILARIEGGIVSRDISSTREEIHFFYYQWDEIGR